MVARGVGTTMPVYAVRAFGGIVEDVDGNRLIDLGSGLAVTTIGNSSPKAVETVRRQVPEFTRPARAAGVVPRQRCGVHRRRGSDGCHAAGVIVLSCGTFGNVLRFLPPLTISDDLLTEGLDVPTLVLEEL